jgi:hypothetical protein
MRTKVLATATCGFVLALNGALRADDNPGPVPHIPAAQGYTLPYQRGCNCKRIWQWLTYRPLPAPTCCQCPKCSICVPPLYLYFIGEYGPRSPDLACLAASAGHVGYAPAVEPTALGYPRLAAARNTLREIPGRLATRVTGRPYGMLLENGAAAGVPVETAPLEMHAAPANATSPEATTHQKASDPALPSAAPRQDASRATSDDAAGVASSPASPDLFHGVAESNHPPVPRSDNGGSLPPLPPGP